MGGVSPPEKRWLVFCLSVCLYLEVQGAEKEGGDWWSSPAPYCFPLCYSPLAETIVSGSLLGLWPPLQAVGYPSSVRYGLHVMEGALNPSREWWVTPATLMPLLHHCIVQIGHCPSWIDDYLSPVVAYRVTSSTMPSSQRG